MIANPPIENKIDAINPENLRQLKMLFEKGTYEDLIKGLEILKAIAEELLENKRILEEILKDLRSQISDSPSASVRTEVPVAASMVLKDFNVTDEELTRLRKRYGRSVFEDENLERLEKRLMEQRARKSTRDEKARLTKEAFSGYGLADDKELDATIESRMSSVDNAIFNREKLDLKSLNKKGVKEVGKGLLRAALYTQVTVGKVTTDPDGKKKKQFVNMDLAEALKLYYKDTVGKVVETVESTVNTAVRTVGGKIAATGIGKAAIKTYTNIDTGIKKVTGFVTPKVRAVGRVVVKVGDGAKLAGRVLTGAASGVVPAYIVLAVTGGAVAPAVITGASIALSRIALKTLADPKLSSIGWVRNLQERFGPGQFKDFENRYRLGEFNVSELEQKLAKLEASDDVTDLITDSLLKGRAQLSAAHRLQQWGSIYSRAYRGLGILNTGGTFGTLGLGLGALLGNPVLGLAAGATIGAGAQALWTSASGRAIQKALMGGEHSLIAKLTAIPGTEILNQIQTHVWLASQVQMLMQHYKWDIGKYMQENFFGSDKSKLGVENFLISSSNWLQLTSAVVPQFGSAFLVQGLAKFAHLIKPAVNITKGFGPLGLAIGTGSLASTALLSAFSAQLGIEVGLVSIVGSSVGGILGGFAAMLVLGAGGAISIPVIAAGALASLFGGGLFGFIGGKIDKAINQVIGDVMVFANGISAFLQFVTLIDRKVDMNNLVSFALAVVSLIQTLDKMGEFANENICLDSDFCPEEGSWISDKPQIETLSYYGVKLVQEQELSGPEKEQLFSYLDENIEEIRSRYGDKTVFINPRSADSYVAEDFVFISIANPLPELALAALR